MASFEEILHVRAIEMLVEAENSHRSMRTVVAEDAFELSNNKFIKLFRINKVMADDFIDKLTPFMKEPSRKSALDIPTKVFNNILSFIKLSVTYIII